jgi:acyl-CoA reductase-like NAD-dependent aldehyde dehydrogenase
MAVMIQGYDPRTGKPAGDPVPETDGAQVDAIVEAAAAACVPWEQAGPAGRGAALEAVASALDAAAAELVTAADTETALGTARLTGEVTRTTGQLRHFATVLADGGYADAALAAICAQRPVPIPFFGELGSVNPVVILPGAAAARPDDIAAGYAASLTLGVGQFCTNPGLLFVPAGDERLLPAIAGAIRASAGGPMLTGRIHDSFSAAIAELGARSDMAELAEGQPGDGPWSATPEVFQTGLDEFTAGLPGLAQERFGPVGLVITYESAAELLPVLARLGGNLAGVVHADEASAADMELARQVADVLAKTVGRVVFNGWPTGVAVTSAQHHGGPFPASTTPAYTSVGAAAIRRWLVPVAYQDFPAELLPAALGHAG